MKTLGMSTTLQFVCVVRMNSLGAIAISTMTNTERLRYLELIAIAKSDVMLASEFDELLGLQKKLSK